MSNDSKDFLLGSSSPSAKFPTTGTTITGTITEEPVIADQRDLDGNLKTWDDGSTMKQLVITLQTNERDPDIEDDKGIRKLYVSGSKKAESKSMTAAIGGAVKAAKANGLEVGGKLTVTYIADGTPPKKGYNAPKQYAASYEPPSVQASAAFLTDDAPATPPPAAATQTPAQLAKELLAAGLDIGDVAGATGLPQGTVAALKNAIAAPAQFQQAPAAPAPAFQQAPAAAPAQPTPEQIASLKAAGIDPATVFPGYVAPF